jgi:hypothetical protein
LTAPNPRRPHAYQISDSTFSVREDAGSWAVFESYRVLAKGCEKDDHDDPVAWFDTQALAEAERERLQR